MKQRGPNSGFTKSNVARQYRDKYGMDMPTLKLARIMYNENRILFKDIEAARSALRGIEGKSAPHTVVTHIYEGDRPRNPYNLPESDEREWTPYILTGAKKAGILSDIHVPYHSISALTAAIDKLISLGIDTLILNGDIIDCYTLSRYEKDPRKRRFNEELDVLAELITTLKKSLNCRIIYKAGNHEDRYDNFLFRRAHELVGIDELAISEMIKKRIGEDIDYITDKRIVQANALDIIHGHEFVHSIFSPVNVARGLSLRAKTNAIQGHNHQTSEHTEKDLRGHIKTTWSTGCLCELHPEYMPINRWNHGFAFVELDPAGTLFRVENYRILDGKIL